MSYFKSYFEYIKKQDNKVKNFHALVIAATFTLLFAVIYLYFVRGIVPPIQTNMPLSGERVFQSDKYDKTVTDADNNLAPNNQSEDKGRSGSSPFLILKDIFIQAKSKVDNINVDFNLGTREYKGN